MIIPIPYAKSYTATAEGSIWKVLECEHCRTLFAYQMQRRSQGDGFSPLFLDNQGAQVRALDTAKENLMKQLEADFDTIPCPECGKYQTFMFFRIRWQRWCGQIGFGLFLLFLTAPLLGIALVHRREPKAHRGWY